MLDLIKPKLVYLDLPLFMALLSDLFPGVELPQSDGGSLRRAIEAEIRDANLQVVSEYIVKIIQVFDCKVARHGNMIVGKTGSGKTEAWKCLQRALARLKKEEPDDERWGEPGWGELQDRVAATHREGLSTQACPPPLSPLPSHPGSSACMCTSSTPWRSPTTSSTAASTTAPMSGRTACLPA